MMLLKNPLIPRGRSSRLQVSECFMLNEVELIERILLQTSSGLGIFDLMNVLIELVVKYFALTLRIILPSYAFCVQL